MKLKIGDYAHNGYCRVKILAESYLKGYQWIIQYCPTKEDCIGSHKLRVSRAHISYSAAMRLKKITSV